MPIKKFLKKKKRANYIFLGMFFSVILILISINNDSVLRVEAEGNNSFNHHYNGSVLNPVVLSYQRDINSQGGAGLLIADNTIKVQGSSIVNTRDRLKSDIKNTRDKIISYIVQSGDTISGIAKNFNISQNTIIWENNIKNSIIRPGQKLQILPVTGLKYKIKKGDTLAKIAKKYKAQEEDIFDFNDLNSESLRVGEEIIIPEGKKEMPKPKILKFKGRYPVSLSRKVKTVRIRYSKKNYGWLTHPAPGSIRTQGLHGKNAIDMGAPIGTPILAAASGTVIKAYYGGYCGRKNGCGIWGGGYGNYIKIKHPNGVVTLYGHLAKVNVYKGQKVVRGQVIGLMGSTGHSTGPHLHFEVRGAKNPF